MDLISKNCHTKNLIYGDIDIHSEKLNLHKTFIENINSRNKYYCITWYFESSNIQEYFKEFINTILKTFNNIIVELTATVEKSEKYHIHVAIMFKNVISIYSKLNKLYNDINIEAIKCSDFENVKLYCSKDYTKINTINTIFWNLNTQSIDTYMENQKLEKQNIEKNIVKVTQKVLERKIKNTIIKQADEYEYVSNKHGVDYKITELKKDILKLKNGEIPNFMNENVIGERSPAFQKIIDDFKETIDILKDRLKFAKLENEELTKENYDNNIIIQNFTNSSKNTYGKNEGSNHNECEEKFNKLKNKYDELLNKYDTIQPKYDELLNKYDTIQPKYDELLNKYDTIQPKYDELLNKYDTIQPKYDELLNKYDTIQPKYDELLNKYDTIQPKYDELLNKYDTIQPKYDELLNKYDTIQPKYDEGLNKFDNIQPKYDELLNKYDELLNKYDIINAKPNNVEYYLNTINSLQQINSENLNAITVLQTQHKCNLENTKTQLENITSLQNQYKCNLENTKTQLENITILYEQQITLLKNENNDLQSKLKPVIDN